MVLRQNIVCKQYLKEQVYFLTRNIHGEEMDVQNDFRSVRRIQHAILKCSYAASKISYEYKLIMKDTICIVMSVRKILTERYDDNLTNL